MMKIDKIIKQYEFKIAVYFAAIVFFLVFFLGIINKVAFSTIIFRIFISEFFFMPLGFFIGHIIKPIVTNTQQNVNNKEDNSDNDEVAQIQDAANIKDKDVKKDINSQNMVDDVIKQTIGNPDISGLSLDTPTSVRTVNAQSDIVNLNKLTKKSLGKHMIINDKKIINDPEIMAAAIRTMMNKDD